MEAEHALYEGKWSIDPEKVALIMHKSSDHISTLKHTLCHLSGIICSTLSCFGVKRTHNSQYLQQVSPYLCFDLVPCDSTGNTM